MQHPRMREDRRNMFKTFLKTRTIKKQGPFVKHLKVMTISEQVLSFCDKQKSQNKVNLRCRLSSKLHFVFLVV